MDHYAIFSVSLTRDASSAQADRMKPQTGDWQLTEDDDEYPFDYLADECNNELYRGGRHRKWVAILTDAEREALYEELYLEETDSCDTLGMLTEYGHLPAVAFDFDPMDWNIGGVTDVIDALLYITPEAEAPA